MVMFKSDYVSVGVSGETNAEEEREQHVVYDTSLKILSSW